MVDFDFHRYAEAGEVCSAHSCDCSVFDPSTTVAVDPDTGQ